MDKSRPVQWARYGVGLGCFLAALAVRVLANGWLQTHYPYLPFFAAVIATAYLGGLGPALTTAAFSAVAAYLTYAPAEFAPARTPSPFLGGAVFLAMAMGAGTLIASLKTARDRLDAERKRYADLAENRDLLYRELQHRVSNNIQVVAGLLRVQAASSTPSARKALTEAAGRIGLIAKIQRELYTQAGAPTPFRDFAQDLLADAVNAAGARHVTVTIEGGEEPLHPDQATPVSLVLLECVNNAFEHAYAEGRAGRVAVSLTTDGRQWRLVVRDEGPGPEPGLDVARGSSFGLKIVRAMATQLQGEFTIADGHPGAVCQLTYPVLG